MSPVRRATDTVPTREAVFSAAATLFSTGGFDGVSMDDIAHSAGVNKAMIYYHFPDKLALYRSIVSEGLQAMAGTARAIAAGEGSPPEKLDRFIDSFVRMTELRPWMPAMLLREIAEGAPRLDPATMNHMRGVIDSFVAILRQGRALGIFRAVHPILAYESVVGPIIINAARERVAAQPERQQQDFPMLVAISHEDLITHVQHTARKMLATDDAEIPGPQKAQKAHTL
jgi:AcrR family transcriptional regulator